MIPRVSDAELTLMVPIAEPYDRKGTTSLNDKLVLDLCDARLAVAAARGIIADLERKLAEATCDSITLADGTAPCSAEAKRLWRITVEYYEDRCNEQKARADTAEEHARSWAYCAQQQMFPDRVDASRKAIIDAVAVWVNRAKGGEATVENIAGAVLEAAVKAGWIAEPSASEAVRDAAEHAAMEYAAKPPKLPGAVRGVTQAEIDAAGKLLPDCRLSEVAKALEAAAAVNAGTAHGAHARDR